MSPPQIRRCGFLHPVDMPDASCACAELHPALCRVEMWRGGLGGAYLLPALSSAGASLARLTRPPESSPHAGYRLTCRNCTPTGPLGGSTSRKLRSGARRRPKRWIGWWGLSCRMNTVARNRPWGRANPDDDAYGYLSAVPFFDTVPAIVQLDLLADVWAKNRSAADPPSTMVDAAVLWGVLSSAGPITRNDWDSDLTILLQNGPAPLTVRVDESL